MKYTSKSWVVTYGIECIDGMQNRDCSVFRPSPTSITGEWLPQLHRRQPTGRAHTYVHTWRHAHYSGSTVVVIYFRRYSNGRFAALTCDISTVSSDTTTEIACLIVAELHSAPEAGTTTSTMGEWACHIRRERAAIFQTLKGYISGRSILDPWILIDHECILLWYGYVAEWNASGCYRYGHLSW